MGYGTIIVGDPQTVVQLCPLQYCINKNHTYKRVSGGIEVVY